MATAVQTNVIYSDLLQDFDIHPVKKDVIRVVNETAVKRAIRNLILTNKGERFFKPDIGSSIKQYLFEPMSPLVQLDIKNAIEQVINNYEPRAKLINVIVVPDYTLQGYDVTIIFYIINRTDPITLNLTLERIR